MKHIFVINPAAGNGKSQPKLEADVSEFCRARDIDFLIYQTCSGEDAENFVRTTAAGCDGECRFYACGGDGTICNVVNGAFGMANAEVGVIPIGTGNDFVRNFSNSELFFDIGAQLSGTSQRVDVIKYNDRVLINMLNTGFDCEVVRRVAGIKKNPLIPGGLAYIAGVFETLVKKPGVKMTVSVDGGEPVEKDLLLTCIGNGSFCGGGFHSEPYASVNDGMMDVCFVNNVTRRKFISMLSSYKDGTYLLRKDSAEIAEYVRAKSLDITFPVLQGVSIDGEIEEYTHMEINILPGGLRFSVPEGSDVITPAEYTVGGARR